MSEMSKFYTAQNFAEMYKILSDSILNSPEYVCAPRGQKILESTDVMFTIKDVSKELWQNPARPYPTKYIKDEFALYLTANDRFEDFVSASKFWQNCDNGDGIVNSAYGRLIFRPFHGETVSQWSWAYNALKNDKDTRQAFMHFNRPRHQYDGNKDQVCTLNVLFNIRDDKLNISVMMRSSDLFYGITFDVPWFIRLQKMMLILLKPIYPELTLGSYTHHSASLHIYERNIETFTKMLENEFTPAAIPDMKVSPVDIFSNLRWRYINKQLVTDYDDNFTTWVKTK